MISALDSDGVSLQADGLIALRQIALKADAGTVLANLQGGFATRRKGNGQEVADVREYVSGDDIRHLDRGTTARTGRLHVRQFQEERDRVTLLLADFRPSMFWGITRAFRSVVGAEALTLTGWRSVEDGGRVGLIALMPSGDPILVPPRGRSRGMLDVIGGLVQAHAQGLRAVAQGDVTDTPLDQYLTVVKRVCPAGSEVVIASGFDAEGPDFADQLQELSRRRIPRLLMISDVDTRRLPKGSYPIRMSDGRHVRVVLSGVQAESSERRENIAGQTVINLDAGDSIEQIARRIAGAFPNRPPR